MHRSTAVVRRLLDPARTIQIGIRGGQNTLEGPEFSRDSGMRVVMMDEFTELGVADVIAEARRVVGDGPTYISFDVDGLDPVYAPGTGTPEIGGITTVEALQLLRGLNLVGGDYRALRTQAGSAVTYESGIDRSSS